MSISSLSHSPSDRFNILIRASSTVLFMGAVSSPSLPLNLQANGLPQTVRLGVGTMQIAFPITSQAPLDLLATAYSSSLPPMRLLHQPSPSSLPAPVPPSYLRNSSEGFLSFSPAPADVGRSFTLELQATNMSYLSVALRLALGEGETPPTNSAWTDPPSAGHTTHTVVLLNGQPQRDVVAEKSERLYVFYVPSTVRGQVVISLDPLQVGGISR
ncbi:hypothetical protein B484DRAFT_409108 [Ochromonadaceae sp. CCMP2298]|nr:hypothetical protein B484DRAFT_409108 [Ochromonadaceae sp. CCMP2298]